MAVRIRLARHGSKKRPHYAIVVANSDSPRDGRYIEKVGRYNPMVEKDHPERLVVNEERVKHWLQTGALPTDRVARFLSTLGLVKAPAFGNDPVKSQPKKKAQERLKAEADAREAAEAAAKEAAQAAANPAPVETPAEAPAEETAPAAE